jgi:hypothetical protein
MEGVTLGLWRWIVSTDRILLLIAALATTAIIAIYSSLISNGVD